MVYEIGNALVSVPQNVAKVVNEEVRITTANVVTDAGNKVKQQTMSTAQGVIDSIGIVALIVCVLMYVFGKKGKALEIVIGVIIAYLVISKAPQAWNFITSFVK